MSDDEEYLEMTDSDDTSSDDDENELWIGDANGVHGLFYSSLIEYVTLDIDVEEHSKISVNESTIQVTNKVVVDEIDGILESAVIGIPDQDFGEAVAALIVYEKNEYTPEVKEILKLLLASYGLYKKKVPGNCLQVPIYQYGIKLVTKRFIQYVQNIGLKIHVWTINDKNQMQQLIDLGVDGIITDRPKALKDLL
mgnify:CR=1 FL=1